MNETDVCKCYHHCLPPVTYYADSDADNFGNAAISAPFCTPRFPVIF
ncbi:MAG: hypothetical protein IPL12_09300 [Bacteroidetes bacterium]|nr:hypothetical protein [Bacteroidota bacterium]